MNGRPGDKFGLGMTVYVHYYSTCMDDGTDFCQNLKLLRCTHRPTSMAALQLLDVNVRRYISVVIIHNIYMSKLRNAPSVF